MVASMSSTRRFTGFLAACACVGLAGIPASASTSVEPRPRGGTNRCLARADTQWVNDDVDEIQRYLEDLNIGDSLQGLLTVASGTYSVAFIDSQIFVYESFKLVGPDDGVVVISGTLEANATASYRIRGRAIAISDVVEDRGTIQLSINDMPQAPQPRLARIFPPGAGLVRFTCRGATLTLFNDFSAQLALHREALP